MTYYDEELQSLQQQVMRKDHLKTVTEELYKQKSELETKVDELERIKCDEQTDVDRLQGRTLTALFYHILGKKEEKLDKERREAYSAAVKYETAVCELSAVNDDIVRYERELQTLSGCDKEYARALKEKADLIKSSGGDNADEILNLEEEIIYLKKQRKEMKEAISAGEKSKNIANEIKASLDEAKNFGVADMFCGSIFVDLAKHGALDEAQSKVEALQVQLRRFKTELTDVKINDDIHVAVEGFLRFADHFFDNLFIDWTVLDKIEESQNEVNKTAEKIDSVMNKLSQMMSHTEKKIASKRARLTELVLKTEI